MSDSRSILTAALAAMALSLALSAAFIVHRPDMTRGAGFLFGDESENLVVADALHRGESLYTEAAFPYGPDAPASRRRRARSSPGNPDGA